MKLWLYHRKARFQTRWALPYSYPYHEKKVYGWSYQLSLEHKFIILSSSSYQPCSFCCAIRISQNCYMFYCSGIGYIGKSFVSELNYEWDYHCFLLYEAIWIIISEDNGKYKAFIIPSINNCTFTYIPIYLCHMSALNIVRVKCVHGRIWPSWLPLLELQMLHFAFTPNICTTHWQIRIKNVPMKVGYTFAFAHFLLMRSMWILCGPCCTIS